MGCCNSTEKKPKAEVKPVVQPKKEVAVIPQEAPKEEVVKVEDPNAAASARLARLIASRASPFRHSCCTVPFDALDAWEALLPAGACFRLVRDGVCYLYNDSLVYAARVRCRFPPDASVSADWREASAVVAPLETVKLGNAEICETEAFAAPFSPDASRFLRPDAAPTSAGDSESALRECVARGDAFVDAHFPPSARLFARADVDGRAIAPLELRRPRDCAGADGADALRGAVLPQCVAAGALGDWWFACAMAVLAEDPSRVREMFAHTRDAERRVGAYRVWLNKGGWWTNVVVDDYLPTVRGVKCYAHVRDDPAELWVSLLQKAYAKVHGSYAAITGGDALHALQDFSGAPVHRFDAEWADGAEGMAARLAQHSAAGHVLVLSTAAKDEAGVYAHTGLQCGHTYYVASVHCVDAPSGLTLLKVHNPWNAGGTPWSGNWRAGSPNWNKHAEAKRACNPDTDGAAAQDGSFWVDMSEAATYFNGGGVIYTRHTAPCYEYRVQGDFHHTCPSVVLMVNPTEPVELVLTLSQKDKRGLAVSDPDARHAPIMLSVSRGEGNKQRVVQSSTADPEVASDAYNFVVAREVAMTYRFEPNGEPYFVIPRIHRKGTSEGRRKEFVVGIRATAPLEGKVDVQFTKLDESSVVFRNRVTFVVEHTTEVIRAFQKKTPGEAVVTDTGSKIAEADYAATYAANKPMEVEEKETPHASHKSSENEFEIIEAPEKTEEYHEIGSQDEAMAPVKENGVAEEMTNGNLSNKENGKHEL